MFWLLCETESVAVHSHNFKVKDVCVEFGALSHYSNNTNCRRRLHYKYKLCSLHGKRQETPTDKVTDNTCLIKRYGANETLVKWYTGKQMPANIRMKSNSGFLRHCPRI